MRTLNLGILAHVDAGKTSLTERVLHTAGVIDEIGSVDAGSTRTDSLALERRRGITIESAVVSFVAGGVTVNLIDTPGHPDFIAEVERVLGVLDGAVLVVSAVEGVQAQTRVLFRALRRLRVPTLLFVNKVDRPGARHEGLLRDLATRITPGVVAIGTVEALGGADARCVPYTGADPAFTDRLAELLAEHDESVLAAYVEGRIPSYRRLRAGLAGASRRAAVHPVYFGSAITGAGVPELLRGVTRLLPAVEGDPDGPVSGTVFKVERGPAGERLAYTGLVSGTLRLRDRVPFGDGDDSGGDGDRAGGTKGRGREGRITGIQVFDDGDPVVRTEVCAGRIALLRGLAGVRVGDPVGTPPPRTAARHFPPPTLETVVVPRDPADRRALRVALGHLAEQDPLINLRWDQPRQEMSVSLYGEVQKEVIQAVLADEYGLGADFRETTTVHLERPCGTGEAEEAGRQGGNPFLATVGLRVEPGPPGSGVEFSLGVELGAMPHAFFKAVEDTVRATLRQGLHGWEVTDCRVTMTRSGYWPRQSHAHARFDKSMSSTGADFRGITPLVLMTALRRAGSRVHEPVHRFRADLPPEALAPLAPLLAKLRAVPEPPRTADGGCVLEGHIPAAAVHTLERRLPGLTGGAGALECAFSHWAPLPPAASVPERPRSDANPLDREEYLLRVTRRGVGGTF